MANTTPEHSFLFHADDFTAQFDRVHDPEAVAEYPAYFDFSTRGTETLGQVAVKCQLSSTPGAVTAAWDSEHPDWLLLKPAKVGTAHSLKVMYRGVAAINLVKPCQAFSFKIPRKGRLAVPVSEFEHPVLGWTLRLDFGAAKKRIVKAQTPRVKRAQRQAAAAEAVSRKVHEQVAAAGDANKNG